MDERRFDALTRALAGASTRRAALAAALTALLPLAAEGKRTRSAKKDRARDRKRDRRAKDRAQSGDRSGTATGDERGPAAGTGDGERAPSDAACLAVGQHCGKASARRGKGKNRKKGKRGKVRKAAPCTKCCTRHAVAQPNGARRCACKPAGSRAGNAAQCCSGRISSGGFCGACDPGLTECTGGCVDTNTDAAHCGGCGNACADGQRCLDGRCACDAGACPDGCCGQDGTCRPGTSDDACGAGGAACDSCGVGYSCVGHACTCPGGNAVCGGTCCGAGEICHVGTGGCCPPDDDADTCAGLCGMVENNCGIEVDCTALCGGCCDNGTCRAGTADGMCGKDGADCIACAGTTPICSQQTCTACSQTLPCPGGLLCCGGACVEGVCCAVGDCGDGGNSCVGNQCLCGAGAACSGDTPDCCGSPGICTDTAADPANCGECGHACGPTQHCAAGVCTNCYGGPLQAAVDGAPAGGTIHLCPGTLLGLNARATIGKNLTIVGAGDGDDPATNTILHQREAVPGVDTLGRGFDILAGATVAIRKLRVQGGYVATGHGGGIRNAGTLTVKNCTLFDNIAHGGSCGGGIANEGGGHLTLDGCTINANSSVTSGGGVCHTGAGGSLTITGCTISRNTALGGGGIFNNSTASQVTITNTTISATPQTFNALTGGGIYNSAVKSSGGEATEVTLTGCTITGYRAQFEGGGIANRWATTILDDTDVTGNESASGGGLYQWADEGSITLTNGSSVGGNTGGNCVGPSIVEDGGTCAP